MAHRAAPGLSRRVAVFPDYSRQVASTMAWGYPGITRPAACRHWAGVTS